MQGRASLQACRLAPSLCLARSGVVEQAAEFYRQTSGQLRAFLVALDDVSSTDGFTFIDLVEGAITPETMNNAGVFVGFYTDTAGTHGLVADPIGGWRD